MSVSTPRASPSQSQSQQPTAAKLNWAEIEDDDDFGFNMPVQRLKAADEPATPPPAGEAVRKSSPTECEKSASNGKTTVIKKVKKVVAHTAAQAMEASQPATQPKAKATSPLAGLDKSEATKSFVRAELLARNLFPSFVEVTVDGAVPYSLKSTAAVNLDNIDVAALSTPSAKLGTSQTEIAAGGSPGNSPTQPDTARRVIFDAADAAATTTPKQSPAAPKTGTSTAHSALAATLPPALAATVNINVADRSHIGRRRRAIRVVADTLVSNGGKPLCVSEVAKRTKWNKTFRPGLGCLFSFIKSLPAFFVYHHGNITLTYEEDIASTMLRTWSETDPQAAELQNMAVSNATALAMLNEQQHQQHLASKNE